MPLDPPTPASVTPAPAPSYVALSAVELQAIIASAIAQHDAAQAAAAPPVKHSHWFDNVMHGLVLLGPVALAVTSIVTGKPIQNTKAGQLVQIGGGLLSGLAESQQGGADTGSS